MAFPKGGGSDLDRVTGLGQAQGAQDGGGLVNGCACERLRLAQPTT